MYYVTTVSLSGRSIYGSIRRSQRVIENPFFIEFLKTLRPGYTPPSKEVLSGKLLSQETAVVNTRIIKKLKNTVNLTLCKVYFNIIQLILNKT